MRTCSIILLNLLVFPLHAYAWGPTGHRVAAEIAESRLTPEAREAVRALLDSGETLADAAVWPDTHRLAVRGSGPWHYVNVSIERDHYEATACPTKGCVVSKIKEFERILADPNADRATRQRALRFTVHLIEDLHQPLHVGDHGDRGGNDLQLRIGKRGTNLHRVWDEDLLKQAGDVAAVRAQVEKLITPELSAAWSAEVMETWANESLALARRAYRDPATNAPLQPGATLSEVYVAHFIPEAERRLAQAAARLTVVLNNALGARAKVSGKNSPDVCATPQPKAQQ